MPRLSLYLVVLIVLVVGGGAIFLATWNIPAPSTHVEQVISNDRFPK